MEVETIDKNLTNLFMQEIELYFEIKIGIKDNEVISINWAPLVLSGKHAIINKEFIMKLLKKAIERVEKI